jgi:hypothetical protein
MARKKSPLDGLRCDFCGAALSTWAFKKWHDEKFHDWLNLRCGTCESPFSETDGNWHLFDVWQHHCADGRFGKVAPRREEKRLDRICVERCIPLRNKPRYRTFTKSTSGMGVRSEVEVTDRVLDSHTKQTSVTSTSDLTPSVRSPT